MAPVWTQLRTVLWRNLLVKRRCWKQTLLEVLSPGLLVVVIILIRLGVHTHTDRQASQQFPPHDITKDLFTPNHPITASPSSYVTAEIMDYVIKALNVTSLTYHVHDDIISTAAELNYLNRSNVTDVGIEFLLKNTSGMISVEGYVIKLPHETVHRMTTKCAFIEEMETCARSEDGLTTECPGSQPLLSGLFRLQWAVETALIQIFRDPGFRPPAIQVQMMPLPVFRPGVTNMQLLISLSMVIALTPVAYSVTASMVTERTWAKVMLKVMGLRDCIFWFSWWITYIPIVVVASTLATVLVFLSGVLGGSGVGIFFLLIVLYGTSLLGFASLVSVFFKAPKIAGCACSVVCVLLGLLYLSVSLTRPSTWMFTSGSGEDLSQSAVPFGSQLVYSLFSPTAMAIGVDRLVFYKEEDVNTSVVAGQFPLVAVLLMLLLDCLLYGLFAVCLDTVFSDRTRLIQKVCFWLTPSYWRSHYDVEGGDVMPVETPDGPHIEPLPDSLLDKRVIRIRDLSKSFSWGRNEPVFGLNGLDLDIAEGQVTCILGHTGSGKTTLVNILAGVTTPSSGVAFIGNLNVSSLKNQRELASVVTFCPQRDFILGDLTVEEHMCINGRLQGVSPTRLEHEIGAMLDTCHLAKERGTRVSELTGCQKRRLSLAMALLVDTKVILLDEPALGMEREERCHLWKFLHARKEGRVIVFTSTHMDEADYYSDRKVVLSRGRLRCVGSSDFLKKHFAVGYRLNMTVGEAFNTERLMRVVRSHVRDATLVRCQENQLTITVPLARAAKLTGLFRQLESTDRGAEYLGVTHFGVTLTTLEQVFWKLGEEEGGGNVFISPLLTPGEEDTFFTENTDETGPHQNTGSSPFSFRSSSLPTCSLPNKRASCVSRRNTTFCVPHQFHVLPIAVNSGGNVHGKPGTGIRRLSGLFTKSTNRGKQHRGSEDCHLHPPGRSLGDSPRRFSLFAGFSSKPPKTRSKSLSVMSSRRNSTAHMPEDLEERPVFVGTALPSSLAERRATVAAFRDFRSLALQKNLSSVASLNDNPTIPPDPVTKLNILNSYDQLRKSPLIDTAKEATTESSTKDPTASDAEHAPSPPPKIGEVLANLKPPRKGVCLELQRLSAMLKLRALVRLSEKRWVLLRMVIAVVLTLVAVGTSHAVLPVAEWSSRQRDRLPLFSDDSLVYRNTSGEPVEDLLSAFSRCGHIVEHVSGDDVPFPDNSYSLQSLLDIMNSNGSAYRLHYNASCALALPRLISFLANVARNSYNSTSPNGDNNSISSTTTTTNSNNNNSSSNIRGSSNISLASNVSAWLEPWPAVARHVNRGVLDWVPVLFLGLALTLTASTFAVRQIAERKDKTRSYLSVTGVSRWMYYSTAVVVDVIEFLVPVVLLVVLCAVSRMAVFEAKGSVYSLALLVALYAVAGVLWVYAVSFLTCQSNTWICCLTPVLVLVTVGSFFLVIFMDSDGARSATTLHYVLTVVWPPYVPFGALHYMAKVGSRERLMDSHTLYVFKFDSNIDICFVVLSVDIVLLWVVVLVLDKLFLPPSTLPGRCKEKSHVDSTQCSTDDSVQKEIQRVKDLHTDPTKTQWPRLVVEGVSKVFKEQGKEVRAVDSVTFGLHQGEVIGLLGPRDAGKSSLLNILIGVCPPSTGSVFLDSKCREVMTPGESGEKIGYCPQYSPLWEGLTVDQHIQFMGQLRGLRQYDLHCFRQSLYHDLDLTHCQSQKAEHLSEGDRRKLSFAMSMVGTQTFMLVDEPSAGMDIRSRRPYWDAVSYFLRSSQRTAVISTQCSEEAQRLCTRLAVMVNGQLRCLGTPEELRSHCEDTYRLEVTLGRWDEQQGPRQMDMLTMFLEELFPGLQKVDQFERRMLFRVHRPGNLQSLADTFHALESLKRNLRLEDFTFSQSDLEQMFLHYARDQKEGESRFSPLSPPEQNNALTTTESGLTPSDSQTASSSPGTHLHAYARPEGSSEDVNSDGGDSVDMVIVFSDSNGQLVATHSEGEGTDTEPAHTAVVSLEQGLINPAFVIGEMSETVF